MLREGNNSNARDQPVRTRWASYIRTLQTLHFVLPITGHYLCNFCFKSRASSIINREKIKNAPLTTKVSECFKFFFKWLIDSFIDGWILNKETIYLLSGQASLHTERKNVCLAFCFTDELISLHKSTRNYDRVILSKSELITLLSW